MDIKKVFGALWPFKAVDEFVGQRVADSVTIGTHAVLAAIDKESPVFAALLSGRAVKIEATIRLVAQ